MTEHDVSHKAETTAVVFDPIHTAQIDFLLADANGDPRALIEYDKDIPGEKPDYTLPPYNIVGEFGQRAGVPAFAVIYTPDYLWYTVTPLNPLAQAWCPTSQRFAEEAYYTQFLKALQAGEVSNG